MRGPSIHCFSASIAVALFAQAWVCPGDAHAGLGTTPAVAAVAAAAEDAFDDPKLAREIPRESSGPSLAMATIARPTAPYPSAKVLPPTPRPAAAAPTSPAPTPRPVAAAPTSTSTSSSPLASPRPHPVVVTPPPHSAAKPPSVAKTPLLAPPVAAAPPAPPRAVLPQAAPKRLAFAGAPRDKAPSADLSKRHEPTVTPADGQPDTSASTSSASRSWPYAPRLKLAYRRFSFARIGSSAPSITPGAVLPSSPQSFESISLDFYPISSYMRVGFSTQFGWESGMMDRTGDYFIAESATLGIQFPGRVTPFVEGLAGGGYMRRKQGTGDVPTVYWQLGVDAGVEIYLAKRGYVSLAVGYLHPANLFLDQQDLTSIKADTWSIKVGVGL